MEVHELKTGQLYKFKKQSFFSLIWWGEEPDKKYKQLSYNEIILYIKADFYYRKTKGLYLFLDKEGQKIWLEKDEIEYGIMAITD